MNDDQSDNSKANTPEDKKDKARNLIMDRAQKLTGALYRVTDAMSDKEPIKWSLRERSIELFNELMSMMSSSSGMRGREAIFEEIRSHIGRLEKILELTSLGNYTASFNFEVLKREYHNLQLLIEGEKNLFETEPVLVLDEPQDVNPAPKPMPQVLSIGHAASNVIKDKAPINISNGHKGQQATASNNGGVSSGNGSRQQKIFEFLKDNKEKTVKEVSAIFQGISEKTVQRDLIGLLKDGRISAKGEKRWRTYSLNSGQ